ncbi:MAG TPA: peptidoglycan-binding domain-containing protein [Solirubrobacteraceae bacterium]|nr:peptidoglycan-binding domain-containing protein [Solirubrobacteraceae bacterium]
MTISILSTRRRRLMAAGATGLALAGVPAALLGGGGQPPAAAQSPTDGGATATAERRDLVARETVSGTLGYGKAAALNSALAGTVTWLPREGATVRRGEALYRVDNQPVTLLYGRLPGYRDLAYGDEGADVRQLERNLKALGYDADGTMTVDDEYTAATAAAVREFQEDRGLDETGKMTKDSFVFLPGPRRVSTHKTTVGASAQAGAALYDTTGTRQVVSVDLDAEKQNLVRQGAGVRVTLPDQSETEGRVTDVGRVAEQSGEGDDAKATISVTIGLRGTRATRRFDEAPVSVGIAREQRKDVLTVPVTALVALPGGGYAVDVVEGSSTRRVRVKPGLFADGYVEVSGAGLREGQKVRVPE